MLFSWSHFYLYYPELLPFFIVVNGNSSYWVLMRKQRRKHTSFSFCVYVQKKSIEFMLSHLKAINNWIVINSDIKNSAIWVEKRSNVFHHYGRNIFVYNISVIFELVMPALGDWQSLSKMKVFILCVPVNLLFGLNCLQNLSRFLDGDYHWLGRLGFQFWWGLLADLLKMSFKCLNLLSKAIPRWFAFYEGNKCRASLYLLAEMIL